MSDTENEKPQPLPENVIQSSPLDRTDYASCRDEALRLVDAETRYQHAEKYRRQAKRLSEDLFTSLIRVDAPWRTPDEVNLDYHINGIALRVMSSLEEFEDLHENARSSRVFSEFATEQLIPYIPKIYKDLEEAIANAGGGGGGGTGESNEPNPDSQDGEGKGTDEGGTGEGKAKDEGEGEDKSDGKDGGKSGEGEEQSPSKDQGNGGENESKDQGEGAEGAPEEPGGDSYGTEEGEKAPVEEWDEQLQGADREWVEDLRQELVRVNRVIGEADELFREAGATKATGFSEAEMLQLLRTLANSDLAKTLAMVGDMAKVATGLRKRIMRHVPGGRNGIEFGNNIRLATTSERLLLQNDKTKYLFYAKQAERRLLQHQESGVTKAGGGPIVMCVDTSGSMHGERIIWARALAETTRRTARSEHRDFVLITFSNSVEKVLRFPGRTALNLDHLQALLGMAAGGGTNFYAPLMEALRQVDKFKHGNRADIMFLTDGSSALSSGNVDDIKTTKAKLGVKIHSVFIDTSNGSNDVPEILKRFSDSVLRSTRLNAADGAVTQAITLALGDDARETKQTPDDAVA